MKEFQTTLTRLTSFSTDKTFKPSMVMDASDLGLRAADGFPETILVKVDIPEHHLYGNTVVFYRMGGNLNADKTELVNVMYHADTSYSNSTWLTLYND